MKPRPERVIPELARKALAEAKQRTHIWTHYILLHYRATDDLAPGCDYRDLLAWLEANELEGLAAKTGIRKGR